MAQQNRNQKCKGWKMVEFIKTCDHYLLKSNFNSIILPPYGFKGKRAHKARDMQFFLQNVQNRIFKILEMFKSNMKFTRAACWIYSKISNRNKKTTFMIFLFLHYCKSWLWWNYCRSLILRNSTSWSRLDLTVQLQLALYPCDPFLINNHNMNGNSVEK